MNRIVFVGTGGGRHAVSSQVRKTGGIFVELDGLKFIIDPGPGSLVFSRFLGLEPEKWDGMLLSHYHIDQSSDANALIDGMKDPAPVGEEVAKEIFLIAEEHCVNMKKDHDEYPRISKFHQRLIKNLHAAKPGQDISLGKIKVKTTGTEHGVPNVGFVISGSLRIGYPSDGIYYSGQEKKFDNCDILILNVPIPKGGQSKHKVYMSVDDAIKLVKSINSKPRIVILTHFSPWMLRSNLFKQAKIMQDATGVKTIFAQDFMEMDIRSLQTRILALKI